MRRIGIVLFLFGLLVPVYAEKSYKELSNEFNLVYREGLRTKIKKLPKQALVKVFLKDGTSIKGTFTGFSSYDDSVWVRSLNSRWSIFSNEAYDVRQIQDIRIIILRGI